MPSPLPTRKTEQKPMSWGAACEALVVGRRVTREAWGDPNTVILLHAGSVHIRKPDGSLHTLIVSEGDLTAEDWIVAREN